MVYKTLKMLFVLLLMAVVPAVGCYRYYFLLGFIPEEAKLNYSYWLLPKWSPVMFASHMYLYGSIVGVLIGLTIWKKGMSSVSDHLQRVGKMAAATLSYTLVGVLTWFVFDAWFTFGRNDSGNISFLGWLVRDFFAYIAVFQNIMFWAILAYGLVEIIRWRVVAFTVLVGLQLFELFWGMHHIQRFEVVLPTAVSRIPIALAFPVWRENSWAAEFPSLIASTPMTLTSQYQVVEVGIPWIVTVEVIYISLVVCVMYFKTLRGLAKNELVQKS